MEMRGFAHRDKLVHKTNLNELTALFKKGGLVLDRSKTIDAGPKTLEDFFAFMAIPAIGTFMQGVPKDAQEKILDRAYRKLRKDNIRISSSKWVYFVLKKEQQKVKRT